MKRVAIVGGGISGLSCAFYLERMRRDGAPVDSGFLREPSRMSQNSRRTRGAS